jgi:ribokinase
MKALTIGGAMIDTIAIIDSNHIERMSMVNADSSFLLMQEGSKTEASDISTHCGGGAVNAAVSMARLGVDVAALVKLGRDQRAETILADLMQEGISTRWAIRDARAPTGASVLVSSHDRNAAVFTFRGANTLLEPADLPAEAFAVDLVYVSTLSNKSADCFPAIVRAAKAKGAMVVANPGIRQLSSRSNDLRQVMSLIDVLAINRAEAEVLVPPLVAKVGEGGPILPGDDLPPLVKRGLTGGGHHMSLAAFLKAMTTDGPRHVLLTDGTGGAFLGMKDAIWHCPIAKTTVAGTAGAGDAFTSTFAAFTAMKRPPDEALMAATLNAASVVQHTDTQTGLLTLDTLRARLAGTADLPRVRHWNV